MAGGEDVHHIDVVYVCIIAVFYVLFIVWIAYRGCAKNFTEKSIYHRKDSLQLRFDPSLPSLSEFSIRDGPRIRAWLEADQEAFKRKTRNPKRKKQLKKKLEGEQRKMSNQMLNGEICEIAASQLQGVDFSKRLPYLSGKTDTPKKFQVNRSFQDSRHSRFMLRRHSSFFGVKPGGTSAAAFPQSRNRERQNSVTSQRSLVMDRMPSISSLPVHEVGFTPQRTSSFIFSHSQNGQQSTAGGSAGASGVINISGILNYGSPGGQLDTSFGDNISYDQRATPGTVMESSLQEVDEDEWSSVPVSPADHLRISMDDQADGCAMFAFQNLGSQSNKRRASHTFKEMNSVLRDLLETSLESQQEKDELGDCDQVNTEVDEDDEEEDEGGVAFLSTEDTDESTADDDEQLANTANISIHQGSLLAPTTETPSLLSACKSSSALLTHGSLTPCPSPTPTLSLYKVGGSYSSISKPLLRKSLSWSSKTIDKVSLSFLQSQADAATRKISCGSSKIVTSDIEMTTPLLSSRRSSSSSTTDQSSTSKFQVQLLPDQTTPTILVSSAQRSTILGTITKANDDRTKLDKAKGLSSGLKIEPEPEESSEWDDSVGQELKRNLSVTTDYSEENGDTITSLKAIIPRPK